MRSLVRWLLVPTFLVFLGGCAVPAYDETADTAVTALQEKIDTEFLTLASLARQSKRPGLSPSEAKQLAGELAYSEVAPFYAETYADLATLETRLVSAEPDPKSQQQLQELFTAIQQVVSDTEQEQEEGKLSAIALQERVQDINGTFRTIATYIFVTKPAEGRI